MLPRALRRFVFALFLAGLGTGAGAGSIQAQITPADSAAVLLQAAATFEAEGRSDVARAVYDLLVRRFPDTPSGGEAARRLALVAPGADPVRSGRVELQVWSTLFGFWLGGAIPAALGADGPEAYGAGLILGGPGGFLAGRALARSRNPTEGQARAITLGGTWGTWQGFGWANVANATTEQTFGSMVAGGLVGVGVGSVVGNRPVSAAGASAASFGSLWGTWFGVAGGVLLGLEGDDLLTATLLGGNAGLAGAALTFPSWRMSRNRLRLVSIAGVMGGLAGGGLDLIIQPSSDKVAIAIPLAGSLVGLALGNRLTAGMDGPDGEGAGGGGSEGALLLLEGGRFGLGTPVPVPTLLESASRRRSTWTPGLAVTLFRGSF